jgi:hypothetical protein
VIPAAATASTAEVVETHARGDYASLRYVAGDGEANDVTLQGDLHSVVVTDSGAEIAAGPGCSPSGDHSVTCTSALEMSLGLHLGDEDDRITSAGPSFTADGGDGDDVMLGGEMGASLRGERGDDVLDTGAASGSLLGGEGADTMTGHDGRDLFMGGPGPDTIDGGGNPETYTLGDEVSYRDHARGVTVDLSAPASPAGADGEGDTIANVENVEGTDRPDALTAPQTVPNPDFGSRIRGHAGDDVLRGGPGVDDLDGGLGSDRVAGGDGGDSLFGGPGVDSLEGDGGFNVIYSGEGTRSGTRRDTVNCGEAGVVVGVSAEFPLRDLVDQSCRRVDFYVPIGRLLLGYDGEPTHAVSSTIRVTRHCAVTVALRAHGKRIGSAEREIRRGHRATLTIELPEAIRDELAQSGAIRLGYSMDMMCGQRLRNHRSTSWQLRLHDPPVGR